MAETQLRKQKSHILIGVMVGAAGAVMGVAALGIFAGIPLANVILSIPVGLVTGTWVSLSMLKNGQRKEIIKRANISAFIAGAMTTASAVLSVAVLMIFQPYAKTAYLSQEFGRVGFLNFVDLNAITPDALDDIRYAIPFWSVVLATMQVFLGIAIANITSRIVLMVRR